MEIFLQTLAAFLIGAVLVETIVGYVGDLIPKFDKRYLSVIVGIIVATYAKFNIMALIGLEFGWEGFAAAETIGLVLGIIFAGLVLSKGSNGVHDFLSKLQAAKELTKAKTELTVADASVMTNIEDGRDIEVLKIQE